MLIVLLCLFYHLETISAEVSPNISVLGPKHPKTLRHQYQALVLKWFDTEVSSNHRRQIVDCVLLCTTSICVEKQQSHHPWTDAVALHLHTNMHTIIACTMLNVRTCLVLIFVKEAFLTPTVKKPRHDITFICSYLPIWNLVVLSRSVSFTR